MRQPVTYPEHTRAVLRLGLPLIGSHLAQYAITLTDAVMLGRYDIDALAAEVLGGMLFFVTFIVGSGFAWALMPLVASAEGSGDQRQVRRVTRMGMWLSVLFGLAVLPLFLYSSKLFLLVRQEPEIAAMAGEYLSILGWGIVPALLVMVLKSYLAALERTQIVLWVTLGAVGVNVLGNYALIFGNFGAPELGLRGAAIASLAVHVFSLLLLVVYVAVVTPEHAIFARIWRPDWPDFARVFALGWPIGLTSLAEAGLFAASSVMLGWLGAVPLAAHGIALQIVSAIFMVHVGLSNAATVRAGNALGRGDALGLRRGARVAIALSMAAAAVTVVIFLTVPGALIDLFLDAGEPRRPEVLAIGTTLLAAAVLFQLFDAAQVMALGLLRGVQDARVPMLLAAVSYWVVGVPASYVLGFPLGLGGVGVWLGLAFGLALAAVLMMWRFWRHSVRAADALAPVAPIVEAPLRPDAPEEPHAARRARGPGI